MAKRIRYLNRIIVFTNLENNEKKKNFFLHWHWSKETTIQLGQSLAEKRLTRPWHLLTRKQCQSRNIAALIDIAMDSLRGISFLRQLGHTKKKKKINK